MENWQLFTAAFVLSLVDLSVLGAFLWYQLSTFYFAWHLCPMIVNRICELIAFMFTGGMLPSLFAFVQVLLSLFSTSVYANRQRHLQNKLLLAVYCTLLFYEALVALLLVKMGRYLKQPGSIGLQQRHSARSQQVPPYIAFHMLALFTQPFGSGCSHASNHEKSQDPPMAGFVTVQQPDGQKVMLGKVLEPKLKPAPKEEVVVAHEETFDKATDVRINIAFPSALDHGELDSDGGRRHPLDSTAQSSLRRPLPALLSQSGPSNSEGTSTSFSAEQYSSCETAIDGEHQVCV